jgi:hypothetical protein
MVPNADWPADSAHILNDTISDALYAAARNGHAEVVAHLLDRGADINAKGLRRDGSPLGRDEWPRRNRRIARA